MLPRARGAIRAAPGSRRRRPDRLWRGLTAAANLAAVRVLAFHGYLLRGTGSNVYNASLAQALLSLGHEVHLLCQDRRAEELEFVGSVGTWTDGKLEVRRVRDFGCTVYTPEIGSLLPVYVADRYEGFHARPFEDLTPAQLEQYLSANVEAVREVADRVAPNMALANHLVMGPAIVARALHGSGIPLVAKVHGSALEYTVKRHPRFRPYAQEGLAGARRVLVGSRHTAESLWAAMEDPGLPDRTVLAPPGVDIAGFRPAGCAAEARARVRELAEDLKRLPAQAGADPESSFHRDLAAGAEAIRRLADAAEAGPVVAYVGKLLVAKGLDLLVLAWPLVLRERPDATLGVVGFGAFRPGVERLLAALSDGDLSAVRAVIEEGRGLEGGQRGQLTYARAFLDELERSGAEADYLEAARRTAETVVLTGRLEHGELPGLLAACQALVVPSTFPEAFGMVSVEAAACGVLPVSASHSGLAEVAISLRQALPEPARGLTSFPLGPRAVWDLAERVLGWLRLDGDVREAARAALVEVAVGRYSWQGVAEGVLAAALEDDFPVVGRDGDGQL